MADLRRRLSIGVFCTFAALAGCGGGGGTSATSSAPLVPTPAPTATPVPGVQTQTAQVSTGAPTTFSFPAVSSGISATVSFAAPVAGSGALTGTLNAAAPGGAPALSALHRLPRGIGGTGIQALAYLTFQAGSALQFPTAPAVTFTFPPGSGLLVNEYVFLALYDPTQPASGWNVIAGPLPLAATTTFPANRFAFNVAANAGYDLAFITAAGAVTMASPTPSPTPSATAKPSPTATPVVTPSPTPSPAAGAAAPITGPLAVSGSGFGGVTSASASGAMLVGIGTQRQASDFAADAPLGSVTVAVSGGASSSARRAPASRFRLDAQLLVDAPTHAGRALSRELLRAPRGAAVAPQSVRRTRAVVGDVHQFWAQNAGIGQNNGTYSQHPAQLLKLTTHWQIWVDTTLTSVISDATAVTAIANDFENAWASNTAHFASNDYTGTPYWNGSVNYCDAAGAKTGTGPVVAAPQAQTIAFIVGPGTLGQGVGGYFDELNFFPDAEVQCSANARSQGLHSNGMPIVYVGWSSANGASYEEQEDMVRAAAHEFQHLISFVQHSIIANGDDEDSYINEGLSMLAQDLALPRMFPALAHDVDDAMARANGFLLSPSTFSLTGFSGSDDGGLATYNCASCYGEAFVYQRYLYDHFGGDAYTHAVETGPAAGSAHVAAVTGKATATLLRDFGIALAANGQSADPRYAWNFPFGQNLTSQFGTSGHIVSTTTPVNAPAGGGTFPGPFDGGYVFVQVPAGGKTVTITEKSGLAGFTAGIAQH
jgi:hypothetical protein